MRVEAKRKDEEERMAQLRVTLQHDREDYHAARAQGRDAQKEERVAVKEEVHARGLRRKGKDQARLLHRLRAPNPETRIPKPETRNPKPETRNPKPETRNPNPENRNPNPESRTPNPEPLSQTLHVKP
ncbi:hypothetical protein T484DRAFT_3630876 [Baffinella frigidus]|nr:hypothetical protein T484DRAFT_3630876 [Cryptophyta sp. CCMP2293]